MYKECLIYHILSQLLSFGRGADCDPFGEDLNLRPPDA